MRTSVGNTLVAILVVVTGALFFQFIEFNRYANSQEKAALASAQETTAALKSDISKLLQTIKKASDELGSSFGEKQYSDTEIRELLHDVALQYPAIRGVTACYEPYGFEKGRELYCPYYNKGSQSYIYVEDSYDYTIKGKGTAWYTGVIENGATWVDPYYGAAAKEWYVDYGVPFYYQDGPKKGQVRGIIDFSLEVGDFKNLTHKLSVGRADYGIITTKSGGFISHPIEDYIGKKSISNIVEAVTPLGLKKAYESMAKGESGLVQFIDTLNEKETIFVYDTIGISDYGIGMAFFKRDLMGAERKVYRRYINIFLTLSLILVLALTLYFGRDELDRGEIEWISALASLLLLANVCLIGYLQHNDLGTLTSNKSPPIIDVASLGNFTGSQEARAKALKIDDPIVVPTGIFVERMEFQDSYNLNIGGTLWQKYPLDSVDKVEIGFRFPQMSPFAEAAFIEESYRKEIVSKEGEDGYLLVGWDYRVTLRLNLKYADFPFDKRHLDIRIVPLSLQDGLLFVPDLESYDYTSPTQLSGLSSKISMSGNKLTRSYFNFSTEDLGANFGYDNKVAYQKVPTLHYNIHLKRFLLNSFVTYLIPIGVTLSLIYILILACAKTEARQGIIESMAAFFFVLIFSHIDLRKDVVTADLIFMEFFYFITYLMIIVSTINLMAYTKSRTSLFDYNDNQLFRAAYFPICLVLLMAIMLWRFY